MNPSRTPSLLSLSLRVYRVLLWAYPVDFRQRFARDMVVVFRDACRYELARAGARGLAAFWFRTIIDLLFSAYKERLLALGDKRAHMMDTTAFDRQLVGTLNFLSDKLRNGYSVKQIIELIATTAPEPTASAFQQVLDDINASRPWPDALAGLAERVSSDHLQTVIETMELQRERGSNLAVDLEAVMESLRDAVDGIDWSADDAG